MKIDISRVNLLEKDIEDWLYEHPEALGKHYLGQRTIDRWIGRQYSLPGGIADLIGVSEHGLAVVVEIKNVPINKAAVLQVCRYAADLTDILSNRDGRYQEISFDPFSIGKILVGPSIDGQTFMEAAACGVIVFQFSVDLMLTVNELAMTLDAYSRRWEGIKEISLRDEWSIFGRHYDERMLDKTEEILDGRVREEQEGECVDHEPIVLRAPRRPYRPEEYSDIILG